MYELKLSKPRLYRVKAGQTARMISEAFGCPVPDDVRAGDVVTVRRDLFAYRARVGDTYASVAEKFGAGEEELRSMNGGAPVYPTCTVYVPRPRD